MARQTLNFEDIQHKSFRRVIGELETLQQFAVDHFHIVYTDDQHSNETDTMHVNLWRERDENNELVVTDISSGLGDNAYTLPIADVLAGYQVVSIVADEWHE